MNPNKLLLGYFWSCVDSLYFNCDSSLHPQTYLVSYQRLWNWKWRCGTEEWNYPQTNAWWILKPWRWNRDNRRGFPLPRLLAKLVLSLPWISRVQPCPTFNLNKLSWFSSSDGERENRSGGMFKQSKKRDFFGRAECCGLTQIESKGVGGRLSSSIKAPLIGLCGPGNGKQLHANGPVSPRLAPIVPSLGPTETLSFQHKGGCSL